MPPRFEAAQYVSPLLLLVPCSYEAGADGLVSMRKRALPLATVKDGEAK